MSQEGMAVEKEAPARFFILSLAISAIVVAITNALLLLLLLDIASTFQVSEGAAVQLRTVNAAGELVFGLLMGLLAVRFRHKSLLLTGTFIVIVSAIGSFFAPTLSLLLLFFFMEGSGSIIVTIMMFTLIGDSLPLNKKANAISWVTAASYFLYPFGIPLINFIADIGGWRCAFLLFVLPFSVVGLFFAFFSIQSPKSEIQQPAIDKETYLGLLKRVFMNKSGASCLIGGVLFAGPSMGVFALAFYRLQFLLPREYTVYIMFGVAAFGIVGSLVAGRMARIFSAKFLAIAAFFGNGISALFLFVVPNLWVVLALNLIFAAFTAMGTSAFHCLVLEQVPMSRCTMMSFYRVFISAGGIIAPAIGGSLLVLFSSSIQIGYQAVGVVFGGMTLIAAGVLYFFIKDKVTDV